MSGVRALLVDPDPLWRQAIERVLTSSAVEVVASTGSLRDASARIEELVPDLAVIEPKNQDQDTEAWLRTERERHPKLKLIVFSHRDDAEAIRSALASGAAAYVVKRAQPVDVAVVLRQLDQPSIYFRDEQEDSDVQQARNAKAVQRCGLTRREHEILQLVADGLSNKQMARRLWLTEQTVKFHLANIYRKIRVKNRTQASRWAHQHSLLHDTPARANVERAPRWAPLSTKA